MPTIRIITSVGAIKLLDMFDMGTPSGGRISTRILEGNWDAFVSELRNSADYFLSKEGFSAWMQVLIKLGVAQLVVDNTPLRKSFTILGWTIGL